MNWCYSLNKNYYVQFTNWWLICKLLASVQPFRGGHKPGILKDFSERRILREFCATSGRNCNKQSIFSLSFKYLHKTAVDWVNRIIRISGSSDPAQLPYCCYIAGDDVEWPFVKVIITFTFCCNILWKSKFMALEKPGKLGEFFPLLSGHPAFVYCIGTDSVWLPL